MNLKTTCFIAVAIAVLISSVPCQAAERTMVMGLCQELVNQARSYEARAAAHSRIAKTFMQQIEDMARLPKTSQTAQAMDSLFSQYDENRAIETKFRDLYKQVTEESKRCMKSVE